MATFDDAQQAALIEITGMSAINLTEHLTFYADQITDDMKTRIVADIALWETARVDHTRIMPKERNFGALIDPTDSRSAIIRRIKTLLFMQSAGSGMQRTVRG